MVKRSDVSLSGMKEIAAYVGRSDATILRWIRDMSFPAKKICGVWESDKYLVDQWRRDQISA